MPPTSDPAVSDKEPLTMSRSTVVVATRHRATLADLNATFKDFKIVKMQQLRKLPVKLESASSWIEHFAVMVEFASSNDAKKARAIYNLRFVSASESPASYGTNPMLIFWQQGNDGDFKINFGSGVRKVVSPPTNYDNPKLYDMFSPFGDISFVYFSRILNSDVVIFTSEDEAKAADQRMRQAFHTTTLQPVPNLTDKQSDVFSPWVMDAKAGLFPERSTDSNIITLYGYQLSWASYRAVLANIAARVPGNTVPTCIFVLLCILWVFVWTLVYYLLAGDVNDYDHFVIVPWSIIWMMVSHGYVVVFSPATPSGRKATHDDAESKPVALNALRDWLTAAYGTLELEARLTKLEQQCATSRQENAKEHAQFLQQLTMLGQKNLLNLAKLGTLHHVIEQRVTKIGEEEVLPLVKKFAAERAQWTLERQVHMDQAKQLVAALDKIKALEAEAAAREAEITAKKSKLAQELERYVDQLREAEDTTSPAIGSAKAVQDVLGIEAFSTTVSESFEVVI